MAQSERTEERLIERARSGDRDAQQSLWQLHRRWVAAIVLAHRPRTVDVEDLMQETALKFIGKLETLRDTAAFRPWLRRIVINICRGAARRDRPMLHLPTEGRERDDTGADSTRVPAPAASGRSPGEAVARLDASRRLLEQALTLPPEYREPLLLRCVQSLSYHQIGQILEMPVTTVETRLARARRMIRAEIGAEIMTDVTDPEPG